MRNYLDLITIQAKVDRKQSRMTKLCIFLAVFLIMGLFGMADMEIRSEEYQAIRKDGSWHVIFRDLSGEQAAILAARPEIKVSARYDVRNYGLEEGWQIEGIRTAICGADETMMQMFPAMQIVEGRFPDGADEIVCTDSVRDRLNLSLGEELTILSPEGTPLPFTICGWIPDTAMLTQEDAFGVMVDMETYQTCFADASVSGSDTILYVQFVPYCRIQKEIRKICEQMGLSTEQTAQNAMLLGLRFQSNDTYLMQIYLVVLGFAALVVTASVLMISGSMNSSVARRTEFFGMMRCLGATPGQTAKFVRAEALSWCRFAIPAAIAAATTVIWGMCALLRAVSPSYFEGMPVFGISWIGILTGSGIGILTVLLAAHAPAKLASRVSPLTAVSGNAGTVHAVKHAAHTGLLPVEASLGIHHAKSSLRNFLLMSGSFAFSIILFLSFTTLHAFMNHALTPLQPDAPDISVICAENVSSISVELAERLKEHPSVKQVYGRDFLAEENGYRSVDLKLRRQTTDAEVEELRALAGDNVLFSDKRAGNMQVMGAYYSFLLFLYGFLAVILMISAFHIINSISMSVSARMREYRSLYAIGMSRKQILHMIGAEAASYLIFSMLAGIPAGLWCHRFSYHFLVTSRWGDPWRVPAAELMIVLVILTAAASMSLIGPAARIRKMTGSE